MKKYKILLKLEIADKKYRDFYNRFLEIIEEDEFLERKDEWEEYEDFPKNYIVELDLSDYEYEHLKKYFIIESI